jgi:O-antigen ligase
VVLALVCLLATYLLISAQVVKRMPLESVLRESREVGRIRAKVCRDIGYSSCDLSAMLSGASWGMLAALPLVRKKKHRLLVLAAAGIVAFAQATTGGRAGYVAWGATGLMLCLIKWRKYLILAPVVVLLLPLIFPGATARMLTGFGKTDVAGESTIDDYEVTSGRTLIWPHVIDKIGESPAIGYGRLAMSRTGLTEFLRQQYGEGDAFPHPHNMYLETLLDNGVLGSIPICIFWGMTVLYSARLFRSDNRLYSAVGGLAVALILSQLVAGLGSQHFYPRESTMCIWTAMFLTLRVHVEEARVRMSRMGVEDLWIAPVTEPEVAEAPAGVWK